MTYAVYVAKDEVEYNWYSENGFETSRAAARGVSLKKKEFSNDFVSFVMHLEGVKDDFIGAIRSGNMVTPKAEEYLKKLLQALGLANLKDNKLYIFTHWGNGNDPETVSAEEEKIWEAIKECKGILGFGEDEEIKDFKQWSLSSLRSEVLAVGAPRIKVPETLEGLGYLIDDLENIADKKKEVIMVSAREKLDARLMNVKANTSDCGSMFVLLIDYSNTDTLSVDLRATELLRRGLGEGAGKELGLKLNIKTLTEVSELLLDENNVLPIWIVPSASRLYRAGFMVPREFMIETLPPYVPSRKGVDKKCSDADIASERLVDRLKQLIQQFHEEMRQCPTKLKDRLRDWSVGAFRKYCFLDEHVHGSAGLFDIKNLEVRASDDDKGEDSCDCKWKECARNIQNNWLSNAMCLAELSTIGTLEAAEKLKIAEIQSALSRIRNSKLGPNDRNKAARNVCRKHYEMTNKNRKMFRKRFGAAEGEMLDPLGKYQLFFKKIFAREYNNISALVAKNGSTEDEIKNVFKEFDILVPEKACLASIPKGCGLSLRYASPTLKFRVLVVDDKAEEELGNLKALNRIFEFDGVMLQGDGIVVNAIKKFKAIVDSGRTYDFALLDLSLGEEPGSDLSGYLVIKLLHQFFPHMPVIIYSQFSDMGHIARAFHCGAKWFLKKNEVEKLPRQVMSIVQNMQWEKEWRLLNENKVVEIKFGEIGEDESKHKVDKFEDDFTDERKFLTYKCLEKYPGRYIWLRKMGGGLSGAVTFRAIKGGAVGHDPSPTSVIVPTPVIVKIDSHFNTMSEYERYFRFIRPYIANECGRVESPAVFLNRDISAIVYTYAGKQDNAHELNDMKTMLSSDIKARSTCDYEKYRAAFDEILDEILPRIHHVTDFISKEDGSERDAENFSSYPNPAFGEFCHNTAKDLFANYLCRLPVYRKLAVEKFINQTSRPDANCTVGKIPWEANCYEFHGVNESGADDCTIECYDHDDKCVVLLTGGVVDHVVRYRRHLVPGMSLWVDSGAKGELTVDEGLNKRMIAAWKLSDAYQWQRSLFGGHVLEPNTVWFNMKFVGLVSSLVKGRSVDDGKLAVALKMLDMKELGQDKTRPFAVVEAFVKKVKEILEEEAKRSLAEKMYICPKGIVHGDLNTANIMLDSLKHPPKEGSPDITTTIRDSWLIDFARSRRDYISHDFNVFFTSVIVQLFDNEIWKSDEYRESLERMFPKFIHDVVVGERDAVPDYIESDGRFTMIYKMLRRIRKAALKAGVSQAAYTLTTAMACMVTFKLYLRDDKNASVQTAAGLIAIALLCLAELKEERLVK